MQLYCASCAVLRISWYYPRLHPSSPRLLHSFCSTRHRLYTANNIRCIVPLSGTHISEAQSSYSVYRRISASDGDHIWLHACFAPIDTAGWANSPGPFLMVFARWCPCALLLEYTRPQSSSMICRTCTAPHTSKARRRAGILDIRQGG